MKTVDEMIDDIIRREGGYVNHPADRGGPTKYGITLETFRRWDNMPYYTADDLRQRLSIEKARQIYKRLYYLDPKIDQLPPAIQPFMLDSAVNHGPAQAVKFLQRVCNEMGANLAVDGVIGPATRAAAISVVAEKGEQAVLEGLIENRRNFYHSLVLRDPSQKVFLQGWLNRLSEFQVKPAVPDQETLAAQVVAWKERALKAEAARDEAQSALAYLISQIQAAVKYVEQRPLYDG